jgi:hypothetical protein
LLVTKFFFENSYSLQMHAFVLQKFYKMLMYISLYLVYGWHWQKSMIHPFCKAGLCWIMMMVDKYNIIVHAS